MKELYISFITLIACLVTLSSATFAYFTKERTLAIASVQTAKYELKIMSDDEKAGVCDYKQPYNYTCQTAKDDIHVFMLVSGEESAQKGYCVINVDDKTYSTASISGSFLLKIQAKKGTRITFSANWGDYKGDQPVYENGEVLEISRTAYQEYIVEKDVTWEMIAQYYGISVEELKIYNGITEIHEGDKIKIPGTTVTEPYALKNVSQEEEEQTQKPFKNLTDSKAGTEETENEPEGQTESTGTSENEPEGQPESTEKPENEPEGQPESAEKPENEPEGQPESAEKSENEPEGQPESTEKPEDEPEVQPESTEKPENVPEVQSEGTEM